MLKDALNICVLPQLTKAMLRTTDEAEFSRVKVVCAALVLLSSIVPIH